jgi:tetraacyldisaccharide-1-P 4'-kinase
VVAAAGIADPDTFAAQCRAVGAEVRRLRWRDPHPVSDRDVSQLAYLGRRADYVVVTEKDAVKLRARWPDGQPEPLVADLDLAWERGGEDVMAALDAAIADVDSLVADVDD